MALALFSAQPVMAQDPPSDVPHPATDAASGEAREDRAGPARGRAREGNRRGRERGAVTPEEARTAAQAVLTTAGIACQVQSAVFLGNTTTDQQKSYEAICNGGPGYIVVASTPPQTFNCLELAGQAETNRMRDPAADVGQQCTLPANQDPLPVVTAYAREAGIDCVVDRAGAVGRLDGNLLYEVGCSEADGFQLEQTSAGWKKMPCWARTLEGATCRYTTPAENLKAWTAVLAGTDAAACDVQQARKLGVDAEGLQVYEVKCGAGDGYFARVGETYTAQRVHACAAATHIAGGCTLTTVAPAAATSEQ